MSNLFKICEHESVEWIFKKIPKFFKQSFLKKSNTIITFFDVNLELFVFGTNNGFIHIINRKNIIIESFLIKKNIPISFLKIIQTIDVSIAIGFIDGSLYIIIIPFNKNCIYSEMCQFLVPTEHKGEISSMAWSKNSEKLFTGDVNGLIFCTEINYQNKTVSAYEVYNAQCKIYQLVYDYKSLLISSESESFMWCFNTNQRIQIGKRPRTVTGRFGVSFVHKLCKNEEMEIILTKPGGKISISDSKGVIKKSLLFKTESIFVSDKMISLLPCVTSQSPKNITNDIKSNEIKFIFGLVVPINENELLYWSEESLFIVDMSNGKILCWTKNLGKIKTVSICPFDKIIQTGVNITGATNLEHKESLPLYEIWILREPVVETDNKLVRLSSIPLMTSKLLIDPFYLFSEAKMATSNGLLEKKWRTSEEENVTDTNNANPELVEQSERPSDASVSTEEAWWNKIGIKTKNIDVIETLNDMRSNMIELTKKTKEVIFENDEEGLEQAMELTEDGLVIKFESFTNSPSLSHLSILENEKLHNDESLQIKNDDNVLCISRGSREYRKIELVDLEESNELREKPKEENEPERSSLEIKNQTSYEEKIFSFTSISDDFENFKIDSIYDNDSSLANENVIQSVSSSNDNFLFAKENSEGRVSFDEDEINEKVTSVQVEKKLVDEPSDSGSLNFELLTEKWKSSSFSGDLNGPLEEIQSTDEKSTDISESVENLINDKGEMISEEVIELDKSLSNNENFEKTLTESVNSNSDIVDQSIKDIVTEEDIQSPDNNNDKKQIEYPKVQEAEEEKEVHDEVKLTNSILLKCNKWISHRGPSLASNVKLSSMTVNRLIIHLTDTKGIVYVGFEESNDNMAEKGSTAIDKILWIQELTLQSDQIVTSPNGFIMWRLNDENVSVYNGASKILTPEIYKKKVLLKKNWETQMKEIKEIDVDEDLAIIVTKKGQLKVIEGISSRVPYKQCKSVNLAGHITLATTLNGIIWCVTEISNDNISKLSQHVFACVAKDDMNNFSICYWRKVPLPMDLVKENEQNLGSLGGSELIKSINLGTSELAWILTYDNKCFFNQNVTYDKPTGDGLWFQIALNFLHQNPSKSEENAGGFQNRMERIFRYSENDFKYRKYSTSSASSSILISVKCPPKRAKGNGLLWITSTDRNSPCILFESEKQILGHRWVDCFPVHQSNSKRLPGLPGIIVWISVEAASCDKLWLLHKSGELFFYWKDKKIRTVSIPSAVGQIVKISAHSSVVVCLTSLNILLYRTGITDNNPVGGNWKEIRKKWSNNEMIKNIYCSYNMIWLICENNIYYNENLQTLLFDGSSKSPWSLFTFKLNESNPKKISAVQNYKCAEMNYTWLVSDPDGFVYMTSWKSVKDNNNLSLTYISGPRAKSIHISEENLWLIEQSTGNVFVRCSLDWKSQPMGDYWIPIPMITNPVNDLAVSCRNTVFVIDFFERLLSHQWTVLQGKNSIDHESDSQEVVSSVHGNDQDWELLN